MESFIFLHITFITGVHVMYKYGLKEKIRKLEDELFVRRAFASSIEDVLENERLEREIKELKRAYWALVDAGL